MDYKLLIEEIYSLSHSLNLLSNRVYYIADSTQRRNKDKNKIKENKLANRIVNSKGFNFRLLQHKCKELAKNKFCIKKPKYVATSREKLVMAFIHAIESIPESKEHTLSYESIILYNTYAKLDNGY